MIDSCAPRVHNRLARAELSGSSTQNSRCSVLRAVRASHSIARADIGWASESKGDKPCGGLNDHGSRHSEQIEGKHVTGAQQAVPARISAA